MMRTCYAVVLSALMATDGGAVLAQESAPAREQADPTGRFEVASVKANRSGDPNGSLRQQPGGRVDATNMPLRALISFAYQVPPFMMRDAPDWVAAERFDIRARLETDASTGTAEVGLLRNAMRELLAARFKLKVRSEVREVDVYTLLAARSDGRLGPNLKRSTQLCDQATAGAKPPSSEPAALFCGMQAAPGRIRSAGLPLSMLATALATLVERPVVDRTGFTGGWDFELTFAERLPADSLPAAAAGAPSIYAALQEQMGLKLEPRKGPAEVLVIESIERPASD
jgi:uncharacterized protein (TIGR03435 family)